MLLCRPWCVHPLRGWEWCVECAGAPDRIPAGIAQSGDNNMLSLRDKHPQLRHLRPASTEPIRDTRHDRHLRRYPRSAPTPPPGVCSPPRWCGSAVGGGPRRCVHLHLSTTMDEAVGDGLGRAEW